MLSELQRRFSDKNLMHMRAVPACAPKSTHFLEPTHLTPLADSYGLDKTNLAMECTLAKHTLNGKDLDGVIKVLCELSPLKTAFPLLVKLIQIALTIAVGTAHCERSSQMHQELSMVYHDTTTSGRPCNLIDREIIIPESFS